MSEKTNSKKNFLKGIIKENPLFVLMLGTCPALATTKSIEAAIGMGILFTFVLIGSNIFISLLRKLIPEEVKIPCYIIIIATFVTIVKMLCEAFIPGLYSTLGVFISLIVVNCIVLGRAEAYASKNNVFDSLIDALGMGVGYTLSLFIMAFIREIIGTGGICFGKIFTFLPYVEFRPLSKICISLFQQPSGAFLVFGIILAILAFYKNKKEEKAVFESKQMVQKALEKKQEKQLEGGNK